MLQSEIDTITWCAVDGEHALVQAIDAKRLVQSERMAHGGTFPVGSDDPHLSQRLERDGESLQPRGGNPIVIRDQNLCRGHHNKKSCRGSFITEWIRLRLRLRSFHKPEKLLRCFLPFSST